MSEKKKVLIDSMILMENGNAQAADEMLTWAIVNGNDDPELWLAAGLARLRRGLEDSARAAFRMSAWISDDPIARELAETV